MGHSIHSALSQSVHRILVKLADVLPGVLAFLLAFLVFAVIGTLLALAVRRILLSVRLDERLAARESLGSLSNLSEWSPSNSPSLLFSRAVLWISLLTGIIVGIAAFDASFSGSSEVSLFLLPYVTHLAGAVLILLTGTLLSRFLSRSVLIGAVNAQWPYARFLSVGVKWLVLVLAAAMALDHMRIAGGIVELAFGILFGGIVLTLSLAIGLGSRDLVSRSLEKSIEPSGAAGGEFPSASSRAAEPGLKHF